MALLQLFNQQVTVYQKTGHNEYGAEVTGSGTIVRARVQRTTKQRFLPGGSPVTVDLIAYVPPGTSVNLQDRVDYSGENYRVFGKYDAVEGNGSVHHIKLELIKWQTI